MNCFFCCCRHCFNPDCYLSGCKGSTDPEDCPFLNHDCSDACLIFKDNKECEDFERGCTNADN